MKTRKITCHCKQNRKGTQDVHFDILDHLDPILAKAWQKTIQRLANQYSTTSPIHSANKVFYIWLEKHREFPNNYPLPPIRSEDAPALVKNLRRETYMGVVTKGLRLNTVTLYWRAFLVALRNLALDDLFPSLNWGAVAFKPYKMTHTHTARAQYVDGTLADVSMAPNNIDEDNDSFHTNLLVPLSIHLSDDAYLTQYEERLNIAIDAFKHCAEKEIRRLVRYYHLGQAYIESVDYQKIKTTLDERRQATEERRYNGAMYLDPISNKHFFDIDGGDHQVVRNLVAMVHHEMGGLPSPWISKKVVVGPSHWRFVSKYGKNKLLPYLGILSSRTATPFLVLLLLENPRLNVEALLNAKLTDKYGKTLLLSKAGESGESIRITVNKPRAHSQKHNILSPKSLDVVYWLIKFTEPVRQYLIRNGKHEEARWLWLGITTAKHYDYGRLSQGQLAKGFQSQPSIRRLQERDTRTSSFVPSHIELKQWQWKTSLRSLRVSKGVSVWLRSNGDPVKAAQAFGHQGLQVTLDNYIPKAIQETMYERQIRRWQNIIICAAASTQPYLLEATDFYTKEQLHEFLSGLLSSTTFKIDTLEDGSLANRVRSIIYPNNTDGEQTKLLQPLSNKMLIVDDPDRIAVLLIYRDLLVNVNSDVLNQPDISTKSSPKMWLELGNALCGDLPEEYVEIRQLVAKACERRAVIEKKMQHLSL